MTNEENLLFGGHFEWWQNIPKHIMHKETATWMSFAITLGFQPGQFGKFLIFVHALTGKLTYRYMFINMYDFFFIQFYCIHCVTKHDK